MSKLFSGLFASKCKTNINFDERKGEGKKTILVTDPHDQFKTSNKTMSVFTSGDSISGTVTLTPAKRLDHQGVKVELKGEIVLYYENKEVHQFIYLTKDVAQPGTLTGGAAKSFNFNFPNVDKPYESYRGTNADLRYYVQVTVQKNIGKVTAEQEFWVQNIGTKPQKDKGVIMEVGIEEVIMLQIKYERVNLRLGEIIHGKLHFSLVNTEIDIGEVSIIRKETIGYAGTQHTEQETLKKFEVIDGSPISGEIVPMRLYLTAVEPWKLTPTCENVNNKFTVRYYVHLSLCDKVGRRYFKQHELLLWRESLS